MKNFIYYKKEEQVYAFRDAREMKEAMEQSTFNQTGTEIISIPDEIFVYNRNKPGENKFDKKQLRH